MRSFEHLLTLDDRDELPVLPSKSTINLDTNMILINGMPVMNVKQSSLPLNPNKNAADKSMEASPSDFNLPYMNSKPPASTTQHCISCSCGKSQSVPQSTLQKLEFDKIMQGLESISEIDLNKRTFEK